MNPVRNSTNKISSKNTLLKISNGVKICFLLQRRFVYVGHALSLLLRERYGIDNICGYVFVREGFKFLKSQKDIEYTKLILDEDIHKRYKEEKIDLDFLKNLEREYGIPNLWPYIEVDRIIRYGMLVREYPYDKSKYSHEDLIKILQVTAKAILKFLDEEKPDAIIFSAIGAVGSLLLYHIAKKKNIKVLVIEPTRIGNRHAISDNYQNFSYAEKSFQLRKIDGESIQKAKDFLNNFRRKPRPYTLVDYKKMKYTVGWKRFNFLSPAKALGAFVYFIKFGAAYFRNQNKDDYSNVKPRHFIWDRIKRKIRIIIGFSDLYDNVGENEYFAFFPLQFEPEVSTLLRAPFYADQLWLIKQIARSLPLYYKLYVKEHPAMFGYRPRWFYKKLKKIPNIKLIPPNTESFELIKNAKMVVTINATSGWEAVLLAKPVITFGDVFYNKLSTVKKCRAIEELPYLVKEQLENFRYDEEELLNFLAAVYQESADVNLIQLWDIEGGGKMDKKLKELVPLIDLIAEKLELEPIKSGL